MFGNTIYRRVMEVVKAKIAAQEKIYRDGCTALEDKLTKDKEELADKLVQEITGKIL